MDKKRKREARESGGGKLQRSETVTVRLDPRLRYLAEIAARRQRRTLSSFIEWVIAEQVGLVKLNDSTIAEEAGGLWDVDEAERFVRLAFHHPDLLVHSEQILWSYIKNAHALWLNWRVRVDS